MHWTVGGLYIATSAAIAIDNEVVDSKHLHPQT